LRHNKKDKLGIFELLSPKLAIKEFNYGLAYHKSVEHAGSKRLFYSEYKHRSFYIRRTLVHRMQGNRRAYNERIDIISSLYLSQRKLGQQNPIHKPSTTNNETNARHRI